MRKPLEMRGWAVAKLGAPRGFLRTDSDHRMLIFSSRREARDAARWWTERNPHSHRYTVVPVIVRERR